MSESEKSESHMKSLSLLPGDLILIKTPSAIYEAFRRLADHQFDHIAVVIDEKMSLHISYPRARQVPTLLFTHKKKNPLIIRPKFTEKERAEFVQTLIADTKEKPYDYFRVLQLLISKQIYKLSNYDPKLNDKIVCSHQVYQSLTATLKPLAEHFKTNTDYDLNQYGTFTISDFVKLGIRIPSQFELFELYSKEELGIKGGDFEGITVNLPNESSILSKALSLAGISNLMQIIKDYNTQTDKNPVSLSIFDNHEEMKQRIIMYLTVFNLVLVTYSAYKDYKELYGADKDSTSRLRLVKEVIVQLSHLLLVLGETKMTVSSKLLKPMTKLMILAYPSNDWKLNAMKVATMVYGVKNKVLEKFKL